MRGGDLGGDFAAMIGGQGREGPNDCRDLGESAVCREDTEHVGRQGIKTQSLGGGCNRLAGIFAGQNGAGGQRLEIVRFGHRGVQLGETGLDRVNTVIFFCKRE